VSSFAGTGRGGGNQRDRAGDEVGSTTAMEQKKKPERGPRVVPVKQEEWPLRGGEGTGLRFRAGREQRGGYTLARKCADQRNKDPRRPVCSPAETRRKARANNKALTEALRNFPKEGAGDLHKKNEQADERNLVALYVFHVKARRRAAATTAKATDVQKNKKKT